MEEFTKAMDNLPIWLKIVLAIPVFDVIWSIYRIVKAVQKQDSVGIVVWVLLTIFLSWNVLGVIDIVLIVLTGNPLYYDFSANSNGNNGNKDDDVIDVDLTDSK